MSNKSKFTLEDSEIPRIAYKSSFCRLKFNIESYVDIIVRKN